MATLLREFSLAFPTARLLSGLVAQYRAETSDGLAALYHEACTALDDCIPEQLSRQSWLCGGCGKPVVRILNAEHSIMQDGKEVRGCIYEQASTSFW